jgi:diaminopropionate ammonia-lyase
MFLNPSASSWRYHGPDTDAQVLSFHRKLPEYNQTPLVSLPDLAKELGVGHVLLKDESNRFGLPAFKILGASWVSEMRAIWKLLNTNSIPALSPI